MKPPIHSREKQLEQLVEQLVDNSTGLIQADLKLRASGQHRDELTRSFDKEMAFTRRMQHLILLLLLVCFLSFGIILYLLYPHWLPEHWATFSTSIKQP